MCKNSKFLLILSDKNGENGGNFALFCGNIWSYQKKAVPLHPLSKRSNGPLAQLNRVPHYGCGGCRFESCTDHEKDR